jgi:hypothetical protein
MRRFDDEDLTGAQFRECGLSRARLVGVVMQDAEIDGLITNLVVNGVEVMPYVEAELDHRHPVRLLIRSDDPADLVEAWPRSHPSSSRRPRPCPTVRGGHRTPRGGGCGNALGPSLTKSGPTTVSASATSTSCSSSAA